MPYPKPVIFSAPFGANYFWHILAVARIGYDSEYATTYRRTIAADDLSYLGSNRSYLVFAEGEGGDLAGLFSAFPAWLRLSDPEDLRRYFAALDSALHRGTLEPFIDAFPDANWSDRFMAEALAHPDFPDDRDALLDISRHLAEIYQRSWPAYEEHVWPDAESALLRRATDLQKHFDATDYIRQWEQLLGMAFAGPHYDIALCFANKNGPDYNSLGYDSNLIYYDKPLTKTCQFVSHEIATHLLIDLYFEYAKSGKYEHRALYAAYETLAMFYNRKLLGVSKLAYDIPQFDDESHLKLYEEHYHDGVSPADLLKAALDL